MDDLAVREDKRKVKVEFANVYYAYFISILLHYVWRQCYMPGSQG